MQQNSKAVLSIISIFIFGSVTQAEYRAFVLKITNNKTNTNRFVESTLDPEQYKTIYPLNPDEKISYVNTWRCPGRTDQFKIICPEPDRRPAQQPSLSLENSK